MSPPRRPQRNAKPELLAGRKRSKSASFLDETPLPYLLLDPSGTIVEANPPAARLLGREQADLQRLPLREFVCDADREKYDSHLDQCRGGGEKTSTELKLDVSGTPLVELISPSYYTSRSRKQLLHMIIHKRPMDGNGSPAVESGAREIQKLNRTLRAMSESSQAMTRATDEAAYMNDVCRIVQQDCGHAMVWIGLARDDEGKGILPVVHAGFEEGYLDTLRLTWADTERGRGPTGTAVRTGQPVICRNMRTDPRFKPWREEAIRRGYAASIALPLVSEEKTIGALTIYSREPDPFSADEVRLLSELAGDLSYGLTALRLRTAHEVAERSLRESETRYRALFDSMAEGFALHEIITDSQGQPCDYRFLEVNPSFERLTGLTRGELIGKRVLEVLPGNEPIWIERYGKVALTGEPARFDSYSAPLARWYEVFAYRPAPMQFAVTFADITERKRVEAEHREVEERVRRKLESVLKPEGDLGVLELGDIIDVPAFQKLMNDFYAVSHFPMSIVDMKGRVLVGVGWQDICTRFHRVNPETCKLCLESDTQLSAGVARGEFRQYRCKNNLWDIATPIVVAGRQVGNVFSGQFFFDDETVNREAFRAQARRYRFDEEQYLSALDRVPRLGRKTVEDGMAFLLKLADMLSQLGYSNAQLARLLAERDRLAASLHEEKERLKRAQEIAHLGSWELDVASGTVTWSDEAYRIFGLEPQQTAVTYASFLDHVHPDDRAAADAAYTRSLQEDQDSYDIEHRVVNASTGEIRFVHERCHHTRDDSGNIVRSVGMVRDITEQKRAEMELRESRMKYQALIETTGDFIWEMDSHARYTYCSPQMEELWGLKPEEMTGKTPFDVMPAELRDRVREVFLGYMTSPQAFRGLETSAYDGRGRLIHIETGGVPFFDKDGALAGFRGISRDVTQRKQAEKELKRSTERFALLSETAGALLVSPNPQTVVEELCSKVMTHLDCDIFFNFLMDENAQRLRLNACGGVAAEDLDKVQWLDCGVAICGRVARDKRRAIVEDIQHVPDERTELVRSFGVQAYCCHPLMAGDRVLGTLSFGSRRRPQFSVDEVELMRVVSDQVSVALERIRAEKAHRESEERLQEALRVSRSFAFEWIPATDRVHRSLSCSALLGLTGEEAEEESGQKFFQRLDPADRERFVRLVTALTPQAARYETKYRLVRPDGGITILEESGHGTFDSEGKLSRVIGITTDVTAREWAEQALRESEERFRLAIQHSKLMAWECDKDMRFTWVYNSHFGISDDQLLGKSPADLGFETGMQEFIAHGREVLAHGTGSREIIKHVHADNREEYFDQQIEAVRDVNGNIVGLIGISLDVTERVLAEHRLHKSEESFKLMVAHSGEPMLLVNESGRIECISRMAAVQLGYDDMQLLGTNIERFLDWSGKLDLAMRLKDFLRHAPAPARAVLRVKTGTGSWCWIELEASFVNFGQRPERYLLKFNLINTDISREIRE